jgi:hypothetical protein
MHGSRSSVSPSWGVRVPFLFHANCSQDGCNDGLEVFVLPPSRPWAKKVLPPGSGFHGSPGSSPDKEDVLEIVMKIFVPFSEELMQRFDMGTDELVPFDLGYEVLRLEDPETGEALPLPALAETA